MTASMTPHLRPPATPFDALSVSMDPGIVLVEASAGTGKTFGITMTVLRLLLQEDAAGRPVVDGIGNILVVTFTIAATNELITRIRESLRVAYAVFSSTNTEDTGLTQLLEKLKTTSSIRATERLREALASVDRLSVFTIHGFCKRVLDEYSLESGIPFGASLVDDEAEIVRGALEDWWRRTTYENPTLAPFAVRAKLHPQSFAREFKRWRCWPATRFDPKLKVDEALEMVQAAQRQLATCWNASDVLAYFASLTWLSKAPLGKPGTRDRVVAQGTAATLGDMAATMEFVKHCTCEALQRSETGAGKRGKAQATAHAGIADQKFVKAADALDAALTSLHSAMLVDCLESTRNTVASEKARLNALGFDDLLVRLRDALQKGGSGGLLAQAIRKQYQAALIDEFQDTDAFQFPIFSTAFHGRPLFLIGDPKQAIFGFRGADVFAYLSASSSATRVHSLDTNYRGTPEMIGAVNELFSRTPNAFLYDRIAFQRVNAALPNKQCPLPEDGKRALHFQFLKPTDPDKATTKGEAFNTLAIACVNEVARLVKAQVKPGTIAILVRTGKEGITLERLLRKASVPAVVSGMGDILESVELKEIHLLLRALASPRNAGLMRSALATQLWGATHGELLRLVSSDGEADWEAVLTNLEALRELWSVQGFVQLMQRVLQERRVLERLLPLSDGERRLTNFRHAIEIVHDATANGQLDVDGTLHWIASARNRPSDDPQLTELRLESDADAVQIVTIHKAKGLEYDVVFCPSLWSTRLGKADEPVLVHLTNDDVVFDIGSPERDKRERLANAERLAEDLRLAYVALTRARYRTYVGWGAIKSRTPPDASWHSALGYLLHGSQKTMSNPCEAADTAAAVLETSIAGWEKALQTLVAENHNEMSMEVVSGVDIVPFVQKTVAAEALPLACREPLPAASQFDTWSIASYTTLTSGAAIESTRDVDDVEFAADVQPPSETLIREAIVAEKPARDDFSAFPAGRRPGIILHELFERTHFSATHDEIRDCVADVLVRDGLAETRADARVDAAAEMMERVFAAPLTSLSFALRDVAYERTLREWEFLLPLGRIDRRAFADRFQQHGGMLGASYAKLLRQLPMRRVHGYLAGFVDLVFEHHGRWYVVDWKSNQLGRDPEDYSHESLTEVMHASHYTLQYHLYVLALHRFLKTRVADYAYESHMGGIAYAFLRGFTGASDGWYIERPPVALIESLDELMTGGENRGAA
jgi:exodeoxyribonuclease V beta subunit